MKILVELQANLLWIGAGKRLGNWGSCWVKGVSARSTPTSWSAVWALLSPDLNYPNLEEMRYQCSSWAESVCSSERTLVYGRCQSTLQEPDRHICWTHNSSCSWRGSCLCTMDTTHSYWQRCLSLYLAYRWARTLSLTQCTQGTSSSWSSARIADLAAPHRLVHLARKARTQRTTYWF